jgi:phosphohistidine phosphatase
MKLWVLRHGEAETYAKSDALRNLTATGAKQIQAQALRWIPAMSLQHIWVSPLTRTQQTLQQWTAAAAPAGALPRAETVDWLLPETGVEQVVQQLCECAEDSQVLLVSHQPLVSELVAYFSGEAAWSCAMGTGYLAELSMPVVAKGLATAIIHAPETRHT